VKPHKVRYSLERRDPDFDAKMAEVLCVYKEVEILKEAAAGEPDQKVAVVSYDEKPGTRATFARDHEYERHGTLSLLAGIDLLTGKVHARVEDRHRSCDFIEFLKLLDAAYPPSTTIRVILDNRSAHTSKETRAWLEA